MALRAADVPRSRVSPPVAPVTRPPMPGSGSLRPPRWTWALPIGLQLSRRHRCGARAMPLAWEASLRLVDEVNQLRFSCPQHELLALLDDLPSPSSPPSPSSSSCPANGRTANAANAAYLPPPAAERRRPDVTLKLFLYGADGAPSLGAPVVPCKDWRERPLEEILESALSELKRCGFVVLEELVCPEKLQALLADFRRQRTAGLPEGVTFSRMRAQRDMTVPPFNKLWAQDDVICHPLILALLARYVRNSTNMSEDRVSEERLEELQAQGLNITPGKGRHKLTLLRERGYFLPVDPLPSWLDRVSNDPQPSGWKDGMRKALGEVPRSDGGSKVEPGEKLRPCEEHGTFQSKQLVMLHGLQSAAELNGRLGRLQRYDANADRWEVDMRGEGGRKRLKEDNLSMPQKPQVPPGLSVAELKERGNNSFKASELEEAVEMAGDGAIAFYSAALDLLEEGESRGRSDADAAIGREARTYAMRANMDTAKAIEVDPTSGKAYYRRGCAVLGMAPSASRAKEAIACLETALTGRASGGKDGVVLPNAMRQEVSNLLDYAKRRLDACTEAAVPDVEQCRENCRQQ
ncbi:unnamed protein product [Effrenium voratum]|nr:unnamed protein product [Effrenium voratum]